jgi:2-polyprenyl-3-methyl-5-hydroxy-6-metoxy-1,4-benzoquinol methylase
MIALLLRFVEFLLVESSYGLYTCLVQKSTEQAGGWQAIWNRQGFLDRFISTGRSIYDFFSRRILRRYLTAESHMLELGCGRASLMLSLASGIERVVGVDISDSAVHQAENAAHAAGLLNAKFLVDDCTRLSLEERFDLVWSQGLLEHFEDPIIVASEHYRMLKPGGVALLSVPYKYSYHTFWYKITRPRVLRFLWPWTSIEQCFFSRKELLAVGKAVTSSARVFFLHPLPLGMVLLNLHKPMEKV